MNIFKVSNKYSVSVLALAIAIGGSSGSIAQVDGNSQADAQDEIIVTARKRDETLTEIPLAVSAFSQNDIDKLGITSAEELSQATPSFDFQNVGTGGQSGRANPQLRFRGVGLQISDPNAPVAGTFYDGVFIPQGIGLLPLVDLQQVEVIKGPQTAFFGRNTFAGAANFIPGAPTDEFEGRISAEGSFTDVDEGYSLAGTFSGPLTEDLRGRVTLVTSKTPGAHRFDDGSPLGEENSDAVIGSLDLDLSDRVTLSYTGFFIDGDDTSGLSSIDATNQDCDRTFNGTLRSVVTGETIGDISTDLSAGGTGSFPFGPFLNFNNPTTSTLFCGEIPEFTASNQNNPAFSGAPTVDLFTDTPGGFNAATFQVDPPMTAQQNLLASSFFDNIELPAGTENIFDGNFVSAPGGIGNTYRTWRNKFSVAADIGSGFTLDSYISNGRFQNWGTFDNTFGTGDIPTFAGFINNNEDLSAEIRITSPSEGKRLRYSFGVNYQTIENDAFQTGFNALTSLESETVGIFGSVDFDVTDEFTISGEGRWQDDESDLLQDGVPGAAFDPQSQGFSKFMPRVILSYQPEALDLNLYGSWSQSYIAGNQTGATTFAAALLADAQMFNPAATAADTGFDADAAGFFTPIQKLDAFEIGLKHQLSSNFRYAIAAYQMDWENQVFFTLSPTFVALSQPGDSEYTGVEVEAEYTPSDWLTLSGGINYVDGTYTDFFATGSIASAVLAPGVAIPPPAIPFVTPGTPGPLNNTTAIDASGNEIRYNPALTGTFSAEIALDGLVNFESFLRADVNYTGSFFIDNFEFNEVDAAARINLRAGAQIDETFGIEFFGNNITDDLTPTTQGGTTFTDFGSQNSRRFFSQAPRGSEYGVKVTANF